MSCFPAVTSLWLILKYGNLVTFKLSQRSSSYLGAFDSRVARNYISIIINKQYTVQVNGIAFRYVQSLDLYLLVRGYLILFTAGLNNSVNFYPSKVKYKFTPLAYLLSNKSSFYEAYHLSYLSIEVPSPVGLFLLLLLLVLLSTSKI